jgi:hypothetical protein
MQSGDDTESKTQERKNEHLQLKSSIKKKSRVYLPIHIYTKANQNIK